MVALRETMSVNLTAGDGVVAGNALSPVQSLAEMVNKIAATNLSLRIKSPDTEDEISNLAHTFNMLLERLETAFKAQEHFVANASHQLNTPLSIIKGELEVLESKSRSPEEIEKFHRSLKEELERLINLVKNLLMIARVEAGQEDFVYLPQRVDEHHRQQDQHQRPQQRRVEKHRIL
jgi:signal transduction histidine kinase